MNLQIQCPRCSKRFTIHEDLTGKTVECGACDHRFPVKPGSIIAERSKIYPGEQKHDDFLDRLGRDPSTVIVPEYQPQEARMPTPQVDAIMPASAGQNIATVTGVVFLILYSLVFFLGTVEGGNFQDINMTKRLILGAFVSILGAGLILFGSKNWRSKAVMLSVVLTSALLALIVIRPVYKTPVIGELPDDEVLSSDLLEPADSSVGEEKIKELVGYSAMERQLVAMSERFEGDPSKYLVGIFIKGLKTSQFHSIEKYLQSALEIPPSEGVSLYSRNKEQDSLVVVSGMKLDFDAVVRACDPRLGRATTYPELRLIDLKLSALHDQKPSEDLRQKLSDPRNPSFFTANLSELGVLDPPRVKDAIVQLSRVPADVELRYRDEISEALMGLLALEQDPIVLADLGKALRIWARGNQASIDIISRRVEKWIEEESAVPPSLLDYLIENNAQASPQLVDALWSKNPEKWAGHYISLGSAAEDRMIQHLEESSMRLRKAAAFVLASIGTEKSLPRLSKFRDSADDEFKVLLERAIEAIKSR